MHGLRPLAAATYRDIVHRPIYLILVSVLGVAIFASQYITLFSFYQEMNLVREMGVATITFFGFLVIVVLSGIVVTTELEDRTAVTLLSKPVSRAAFLLGKYLGILRAILPGMIFLAGILFLTLWLMAMPNLYGKDTVMWMMGHPEPGTDAPLPVMQWNAKDGVTGTVASETWGCLRVTWKYFVLRNGGVVLEGAFLSFLQIALLAALAVSFSAFFPVVVSASATALLFVLGNISSYMLAAVERWQVGVVTVLARAFYYLLPNLGYFNLQTFYSEGRIISLRYLGLASVYAVGYTAAVFLVSCALFRRREIR